VLVFVARVRNYLGGLHDDRYAEALTVVDPINTGSLHRFAEGQPGTRSRGSPSAGEERTPYNVYNAKSGGPPCGSFAWGT